MNVLRGRTICGILLIAVSTVCAVGETQAMNEEDAQAKETQARGYWVDSSSGLMWAAKDNGKDVNWHQAASYCQKLRVGGYTNWRLATIDQLEDLIDIKAYAPQDVGTSTILHFNLDSKVHGGLLLTGHEWSSTQDVDDRGKLVGNAWYFDFINVDRSNDDGDVGLRDRQNKRALCVRDAVPKTENQSQSNGAQAAATNSDPATGLTWVTKDNGKDVNLSEAIKYCRDLRADGYSAWRLATIQELERIYNLDRKGPENAGNQGSPSIHPNGGRLGLTGDPWSNSLVFGLRWYLSRKSGTRVFDNPSFSGGKRAVCVHGALDSSGGTQLPEQQAQARDYWIDPVTGLMWAGIGSLDGSHFYRDAISYCQRLRLAGHNDWRLATANELQSIYDPNAESPGAVPRSRWQQPEAASFHVKGSLFLTGLEWVNAGDNDDRNPSQDRLLFDFKGGQLVNEKRYFVHAGALCVRGRITDHSDTGATGQKNSILGD